MVAIAEPKTYSPITVQADELRHAIARVGVVSSAKSSMNALNYIRLQHKAESDVLTLSARNAGIAVTATIGGSFNAEDGDVTAFIDADVASGVSKFQQQEPVTITIGDGRAVFKQAKRQLTVPAINSSIIIDALTCEDAQPLVAFDDLRPFITAVSAAVSVTTDTAKNPALAFVNLRFDALTEEAKKGFQRAGHDLDLETAVIIAGSDGFQMLEATLPVAIGNTLLGSQLDILRYSASVLPNLFPTKDIPGQLLVDTNEDGEPVALVIHADGFIAKVSLRATKFEFPSFARLFAFPVYSTITIPTSGIPRIRSILTFLNMALKKSRNYRVVLDAQPESLQFLVPDAGKGAGQDALYEIELDGDPFSIAVNPQHMLRFARMASKSIMIEFVAADRGLRMYTGGALLRFITMPYPL